MSAITYSVQVAWDTEGWQDDAPWTGEFDAITSDVEFVAFTRGKETEAGNAPAATLELRLTNDAHKYTPTNTTGDLYEKLLVYKQIRVTATFLTVTYPLFYGFISRYQVKPHPNDQKILIYATDGMDMLARALVAQDYNVRSKTSDGEAVDKVLTACGWNPTRRTLDTTAGKILNYPECH
jgi:hypothetical protein